MNRAAVFNAITSERMYQKEQIANIERSDMIEDLGMGGTLLAMEHCLNTARATWYYDSTPYPDTMNLIRKIAGLAVQAGEKYGMPDRD